MYVYTLYNQCSVGPPTVCKPTKTTVNLPRKKDFMEDYQPPLILFTALLSYAPSIWNLTKPISSLKKLKGPIGPLSQLSFEDSCRRIGVSFLLSSFPKETCLNQIFRPWGVSPWYRTRSLVLFRLVDVSCGYPKYGPMNPWPPPLVNSKNPGIFFQNSRNPQISKTKKKTNLPSAFESLKRPQKTAPKTPKSPHKTLLPHNLSGNDVHLWLKLWDPGPANLSKKNSVKTVGSFIN